MEIAGHVSRNFNVQETSELLVKSLSVSFLR